jgi:hypothetical protein
VLCVVVWINPEDWYLFPEEMNFAIISGDKTNDNLPRTLIVSFGVDKGDTESEALREARSNYCG